MVRRIAAFALLLVGCARVEQPPADRDFVRAPVVIISIDTLRSDRLPAYGYEGVETPAIDGLRRDGVLFRNAYSPCPITLPAHLSMLTGLLPHEHGVRANAGYRYRNEGKPSLPQLLKSAGYATGASVSSWILRGDTGLAPMFDFYDDAIVLGSGSGVGENERPGSVAAKAGAEWIKARGSSPFLFMLHLYEPHAPYEPPEPFRSRYAHAYDGEIAATDAIIGGFLDDLRRSGVYDRAIIVLTSDHGEGLMDHGEDQHGILLYREAIQVPLIVKLPQSQQRGRTIDAPAQLSDLPATILALTGVAQPHGMPGLNLFGESLPASRRIYSETFYPRLHLGWSELRSLIDGRHHYIEAPQAELYDVAADPAETRNVLADQRRVAAAMREELAAIPKNLTSMDQVSAEAAARLRSLGYLAAPAQGDGDLPNPNARVRNLIEIKRAFFLAEEGAGNAAVDALRHVVNENPGMVDASLKLGEVLTELGRFDEAVRVYEDALRRGERFSPDVALSLATTHLRAGRIEAATSTAALALETEPGRAHEILARASMAGRKWDDAARHAQAAASTGQPRLMLVEAELAIARGDFSGALRAIERAEARNRQLGGDPLFRAEFLRGDALARSNRIEESEAAYRREIDAFPGHLQAWGNLAVVYALTGRDAEFRQLLEEMVKRNPSAEARAFAMRVVASVRQ
ncbi:MAG TPA: sulfatase-like hydrolase/transferase [Thermoanaerobaculia bacterium]|nr:sulfatase-like hydrolase/transferase [Thermoanaerobaculia bacterium]